MKNTEKENSKNNGTLTKKAGLNIDETILLCGMALAGLTTVLCFIL